MKSAGFYKTRPGDIDKALINVVPEAPRTASLTYPSSWDWDLLRVNSSQDQKPKKKVPTPIPEVQPEMEIAKEDTPESPKKQVEEIPDSPEMLIVDNSETFDDNTEHLIMDHEFEVDQMSENVSLLKNLFGCFFLELLIIARLFYDYQVFLEVSVKTRNLMIDKHN